MSSDPAERALWSAIQHRGPFERVYYLHGEEEYLKEQVLRELIASAVDDGTRDFNLDVRAGGELDGETLGSLLGTPPMMAKRRVVVLRDPGSMKKAARVALDRYLRKPAEDLVLVMVEPAGERAKVDPTLASRGLAVEYRPLSAERVSRWIARHVSTTLSTSITPEACALLQAAVGNDLPTLASELEKLVSYVNGGEIDEQAVSAVVGVRRGETLADLLDRVAERDAPAALSVLEHVVQQPKMSGVVIVMALTAQMLAIGWGVATRERSRSAPRETDYIGMLKSVGNANVWRPWGEAARSWVRAADRWDAPSIDAALEALLAADVALKETRVSSEEQTLATLVLTLCAGTPPRTASPPSRSRRIAV